MTRATNGGVHVYEFTLHQVTPARSRTLELLLASDVAASVATFEVLRDNPLVIWIQVTLAGFPVLQRTRDAGKSTVTWARDRALRSPRPV